MAAVAIFRIAIIYNRYFESGRECVSVNEQWLSIKSFHFINVVPRLAREEFLVLLPQLSSNERANGHPGNVASFETFCRIPVVPVKNGFEPQKN